ncbi:PepSY domain-containing protein [Rubrimonas cliftonensis]|uniref:Peptidase propeptide and YPEB domain-containing protein n=1 Tax=Rubrimonas cliftonensis TaxID=89524 RepID=A0A1H3VM03_9RHOB|nr:PepSY domain-containing protein [Rubrimonas cliftonensis]SDZ75810.1 Peptidase propeptide and YPEB domain-containing protein [Rubrimonas cliftonensis]
MRTLVLAAVLAAPLLAGPLLTGPVLAQQTATPLSVDAELGASADAVRAALTAMGYEVRKIETEDGKIEAYVVKGDEKAELYVSPASGRVTKIERK